MVGLASAKGRKIRLRTVKYMLHVVAELGHHFEVLFIEKYWFRYWMIDGRQIASLDVDMSFCEVREDVPFAVRAWAEIELGSEVIQVSLIRQEDESKALGRAALVADLLWLHHSAVRQRDRRTLRKRLIRFYR